MLWGMLTAMGYVHCVIILQYYLKGQCQTIVSLLNYLHCFSKPTDNIVNTKCALTCDLYIMLTLSLLRGAVVKIPVNPLNCP